MISSGPRVYQLNSKQVQTVHQASFSTNEIVPTAKNELDTKSDNIFCVKNFLTLVFYGKTCEVKCFYGSLETIQNVLVGTNATAYTGTQDSVTYIVIYN